MNYSLQKYGHGTKHQCPQCERKGCYVLYVDENNNPLDKAVGRCDHENTCGYHYTPKQYFADHPDKRGAEDWCKPQYIAPLHRVAPNCTIAPKKIDTIPFDIVERAFKLKPEPNRFILFLCGIMDRYTLESPTIERVRQDYAIGSTKDGRTIFFQIDIRGKVRTGKIISYKEDGHRDHDINPTWVHSIMKGHKLLPDNWELTQCLFGEHLLSIYPNKVVALVEAEKTAVIGSALYPDYVWLSVGSVQNLSVKEGSKGLQMLQALRGRKVVIFPDVDGFEKWTETAKQLTFCKCVVSDYVQTHATDEDKQNKIDIADILIRELQATPIKAVRETLSESERVLRMMIAKNPAVQTLIDVFELKAA